MTDKQEENKAQALPDFATFFRALWTYDPFPWQSMLAERLTTAPWPQALDLPTASGKTACIDIALWALASQADHQHAERTAPRRIWFVVDRRIVVDEAFARAETIAARLATATEDPLADLAARLRRIAGTDRPLATARLRGGVFRDDGQARLPSQPAVITSTVDRIGSRLLFRGYGHSHLTAPIFAGLAANDSLILLDEAHCSVPFLQTLRAITTYRGARWAESPLASPFAAVVLSATPPANIPEDNVFPGAAREQALDHPVLRQRLVDAHKPADLIEVRTRRGDSADALVAEAARRAAAFVGEGKRRVAVMVNRVRTAGEIASAVAKRLELPTDPDLADLLLHLVVASHHGHARPFAPISVDPEPPTVEGALGDARIRLTTTARAAWTPHRADSGLADRFWRLTRRYGWWGLAYLEAIVRLGDWYASGLAVRSRETTEVET